MKLTDLLHKVRQPQWQLGLVVIVAFFAYSFFGVINSYGPWPRFNSPDETANWLTTTGIVNGDGPAIFEPRNKEVLNILRPRSMTVMGDYIVPASWLGLPILYGALGLVLSGYVLPLLTPLFSALCLLASYGLWRRWFSEKIAIVATFLWAFHPVFWYFSARGWFHNVLFIDLLIISWWLLIKAREKSWATDWLVAGLVILCLALSVRLNEIVWVGPIVLWGWWQVRAEWQKKQLLTAVGVLVGVGLLWLLGQQWVLGETSIGYQVVVPQSSWSERIWRIVLPLGFELRELLKNVGWYGLILFTPYWLLVIYGWQFKKGHYKWWQDKYVKLAILVSGWLFLSYGSLRASDAVGVNDLTIGQSHLRYWLPIWWLWMPLVAEGVIAGVKRYARKNDFVLVVVLLIFFAGGFGVVYFDKHEGLVAVGARLIQTRQTLAWVNDNTSVDAIIVGERADKIFFPVRRVISPGDRPYYTYPEVLDGVQVLLQDTPVFVYQNGMFDAVARQLWLERGVIVGLPVALPDGGWLFPLFKF